MSTYDDVIKWKHFPRDWPFVRGIHQSSVNSPHIGQWRGALMYYFICAFFINNWANDGDVGDLRRHRAHCVDMWLSVSPLHLQIKEGSHIMRMLWYFNQIISDSGYGLSQWEWGCYNVTPSLFGRAHTRNDPWVAPVTNWFSMWRFMPWMNNLAPVQSRYIFVSRLMPEILWTILNV